MAKTGMSKTSQKEKKSLRMLLMRSFFCVFAVFLAISLISPVSAMDWDNTIDYKNDNMTIVITNWLGLGEELGEATLTSHSSVDEIHKVLMGNDRAVMWYDFDFGKDYKDGLGEVTFIDMRTGKQIKKDYYFAWEQKYYYETPVYKEVCKEGKNGTECSNVFDYYQPNNWTIWRKLDNNDIPKGKVRIALVTDVYENDYLDGVWTIAGKKISLHATWQDSFNDGLIAWYSFDNSTCGAGATLTEQVRGIWNGTITGVTDCLDNNVTGKIGDGWNASGTDIINLGTVTAGTSALSVSLWIKTPLASGDHNDPLCKWDADTNYSWCIEADSGVNAGTSFFTNAGAGAKNVNNNADQSLNTWTHIVGVYNGSHVLLYLNGVLNATLSGQTGALLGTDAVTYIGYYARTIVYYTGLVDEIGIYNVTLNSTTISDLYNGGVGLTYGGGGTPPPPPSDAPNVTLNYPVNFFNTSDSSISFNASCVDASNVTNMTLYLNNGTIINYLNNYTGGGVNVTSNLSLYVTTEENSNGESPTYDTSWRCMTFALTDGDANISQVELMMDYSIGLPETLNISIYYNDQTNGKPPNMSAVSPIVVNSTFNTSEITSSPAWHNISFSSPASLINGSSLNASYKGKYSVCLSTKSGGSGIAEFRWRWNDADNYPYGDYFSSGTWSPAPTGEEWHDVGAGGPVHRDFLMRLYSNETNSTYEEGNATTMEIVDTIGGFVEGVYNWNVTCMNNATLQGNSTSYTFTIDNTPPSIVIINPIKANYTYNPILLNISASDIVAIDTVLYNWNGTNYTYTTPLNITFAQGGNTILAFANDTFGNLNSTNVTFYVDSINPNIAWHTDTPANNSNLTYNSILSKVEVNDTNYGVGKGNVTFTLYNSSSDLINTTYFFDTSPASANYSLSDGTYYINATVTDYYGLTNSTDLRTVTIDATYPILTASNLSNIFTVTMPINSTWWFNATDIHLDSCWYYTSDNSTNVSTQCNNETIITEWNTEGTKTLYYCANDTFTNERCNSTSIIVSAIEVNQSASKDYVGEGDPVTFNLTLTKTNIQTTYPNINATFYFDGLIFAPDTTDKTHQNYTYFEKTLIIPAGFGNTTGNLINYSWNYDIRNLTDLIYTGFTSNDTLTVYNVSISDCNDYGGKVILNMSLKDEEDATLLTANASTIEIDLEITSLYNSSMVFNFSKKWIDNQTVAVCVPNNTLNYSTYRIDFTVGFDRLDYVREFYFLENGTLDNTNYFNSYTSHYIDLLDLLTADSTTFLFEFTDEDGLDVEDVIIHTYRKYIGEGVFREVERSKQDNNGQTHVHLVEEDVIYYFMVTQNGEIIYTSDTYNAKCLSTPCTISLSASPSEINWSVIDNEGGQYSVSTNKATRTVTLDFSLSNSSLVNMTLYSLQNGTATLINESSLTAMSGSIDLEVPLVYNNATFFVVIYRANELVKSVWVDLTENARDYFGTFGAILGGLVVLAMMLMSISEGVGFIIFTILALLIVGIMQLVDLGWLALISIICAGGIIIWKLVGRRGKT